MSCKQRLCPSVGGRRCGAFMSPLFRDPHPTCARCRGIKCSADVTSDICKDWSVTQWEAFLKRRCKKRPSVSALPSAPPTIPPSASASSEAKCSAHPPPSEGRDRLGETEGVPRLGFVRSPLPPPAVWWERRGGAPLGSLLLRGE